MQIFGSVVFCSAQFLETREIAMFFVKANYVYLTRSKPVLLDLKCKMFILAYLQKKNQSAHAIQHGVFAENFDFPFPVRH